MATLTLDSVTKRFGAETVLADVSLAVADKETVVVFGPSGAGKTVLLRLIAGVHEPEEGAILIDGEPMAGVPPERRDVGMAFQNFALFPHMSARDNIASPLEARRAGRAAIERGVSDIARLLKIDHVLGHAPRELSNGQKQRTALARALVATPKILLLDDPLRNVDAKLRFEMRLELPRLLARSDSAILYVTQDYKEAMALGDRIAILMGGRLVQVATPEDIYLAPATVDVARLFGDPTINLIEATATGGDGGGLFAPIGGHRVPLGGGYADLDGRRVRLGIRPEHVRLEPRGAGVPVTVEAVTPLNERIVRLLVTDDGTEILASAAAQDPGPDADEKVVLGVDPDAILLFDPDSGARIARVSA